MKERWCKHHWVSNLGRVNGRKAKKHTQTLLKGTEALQTAPASSSLLLEHYILCQMHIYIHVTRGAMVFMVLFTHTNPPSIPSSN